MTELQPPQSQHPTPAVTGQPRAWLRLESAAVISAALLIYFTGHHSWILLAVLFFSPDLSFAAYLAGPRAGGTFYNLAHTYFMPIALGLILHSLGKPLTVPLLWTAHIAFDRLLGYGLKCPTAFADTHLGTLSGKKQSPNDE